MKKVFNLVKKRKGSSQSSGDDRSTGGGGHQDAMSVGGRRSSITSSATATSSVLQFQRSDNPRPPSSVSQTGLGGAKYNIDTGNGRDKSLTKLHIAVWNENVDKVKKYVKQGFQPEGDLGGQPQPQKRFRSLLGKDESLINNRDRYARTPLHICASNGNEAILWQLLSHGSDVHAKDSDGATPLHRAMDAGHDDTARMILDRGCSLDVADVDGDTAVHLAVRRSNNELLAVLLRKGANPDLKNGLGECPLHEATRLGLVPAAQLLMRGGSEVNIPGPSGLTPLMMASANPNLNVIIDTLLNYEADPMVSDDQGRNALDHAADFEVRRILQRFIEDTRHRPGSEENHSFDDHQDPDNFNKLPPIVDQDDPYSVPFGMDDNQPVYNEAVGHTPVALSDLSSWEDSEDEDLLPEAGNGGLSKMKQSPGIMDLSKFIMQSDDEDAGVILIGGFIKQNEAIKHDIKEDKIYDSVENIPDQKVVKPTPLIEDDLPMPTEPDLINEAVAGHDDDEDDDWDSSPPLSIDLPAEQVPDDDNDSPSLPVSKAKNESPTVVIGTKLHISEKPAASVVPSLFLKKLNQQEASRALEQPKSLDMEKPISSRRRGSRKSRSLRSTHLSVMSRSIVKSIDIGEATDLSKPASAIIDVTDDDSSSITPPSRQGMST